MDTFLSAPRCESVAKHHIMVRGKVFFGAKVVRTKHVTKHISGNADLDEGLDRVTLMAIYI